MALPAGHSRNYTKDFREAWPFSPCGSEKPVRNRKRKKKRKEKGKKKKKIKKKKGKEKNKVCGSGRVTWLCRISSVYVCTAAVLGGRLCVQPGTEEEP